MLDARYWMLDSRREAGQGSGNVECRTLNVEERRGTRKPACRYARPTSGSGLPVPGSGQPRQSVSSDRRNLKPGTWNRCPAPPVSGQGPIRHSMWAGRLCPASHSRTEAKPRTRSSSLLSSLVPRLRIARELHSRLKAWTPNARQTVWSLALQGEVSLPDDGNASGTHRFPARTDALFRSSLELRPSSLPPRPSTYCTQSLGRRSDSARRTRPPMCNVAPTRHFRRSNFCPGIAQNRSGVGP